MTSESSRSSRSTRFRWPACKGKWCGAIGRRSCQYGLGALTLRPSRVNRVDRVGLLLGSQGQDDLELLAAVICQGDADRPESLARVAELSARGDDDLGLDGLLVVRRVSSSTIRVQKRQFRAISSTGPRGVAEPRHSVRTVRAASGGGAVSS